MTGPEATHFRLVAQQIVEGDVIPFLGAGANLVDRPPKTAFELGRFLPRYGVTSFLPTGSCRRCGWSSSRR